MSLLASTSVDIRELLPYPALQKLVTFPTQSEWLGMKGNQHIPHWVRYDFIYRPEFSTFKQWREYQTKELTKIRTRRNAEAPGMEIKRGKETLEGIEVLILRRR
jgi:hypothetical protein